MLQTEYSWSYLGNSDCGDLKVTWNIKSSYLKTTICKYQYAVSYFHELENSRLAKEYSLLWQLVAVDLEFPFRNGKSSSQLLVRVPHRPSVLLKSSAEGLISMSKKFTGFTRAILTLIDVPVGNVIYNAIVAINDWNR